MKNIDDYTVVDILNSYKRIMGTDIEKVITTFFFQNDEREVQKFKGEIENIISKNPEVYTKSKTEIIYRKTINDILNNPEINNDNQVKLGLLSEIYRRFSKNMTEKDRNEIVEKIMGEDNVYVIYEYDSDKYKGIKDYEIITRDKNKKVSSIHDKKLRECIKDAIMQTVSIDNVQGVMKRNFSGQVYNTIIQKLLIRYFLDDERMSVKEFKNNLENDGFNNLLKDEKMYEEFGKLLEDYLSNNLQYIDKNSLLLNAAAITILGLQMEKEKEIDELALKNDNFDDDSRQIIMEGIKYIRTIYEEISQRKYEDVDYRIMEADGKEVICVNKEYISDFLSRCTKDDYITDEEIEQIHKDILEGKLTPDIEKRKIANVNINDLINASKSYEEKEEGSLEKEKILKCSIELAKYLIDEKNITNEKFLDMYLHGDFNVDIIAGIDIENFSEEYYSDKFKNLYYEIVFSNDTEKAKENLKKFSDLCIHLEQNEKISIDREQLIGDIVTVLGDDFAPEILSDLLETNIITLDKAIEWVGADVFFEEYKKGKLKPEELRKFYEEDKENRFDEIATIINKLPDNGEKFMVIGSIFPGEGNEDRETRDSFFDKCLRIDSGIENNKNENKRKNENTEDKTNEYYKHITDPFARISLIRALDKDYSFEMTPDGHAIVKFPNLEKVIIEKMLDKNKQPSYGAATYILDMKYYEDNKFRIKKDEKVCRQEIIKDIDNKQVTRIIHSVNTWGTDIKEYFLQTQKKEWSQDEITEIDNSIERVKRSDPIVRDKKEKQELAKMIVNLITTRKATMDEVVKIAEIYGMEQTDIEKVMDSLYER